MPNITPNLGLYLPLVNDPSYQDLWGGYLNANFSLLDTTVSNISTQLTALAATVAGLAGVPSGTGPVPFSGSTVPTGWLECDGSNVSRTTYAALFAAIGTTFGSGNGSTTFTLPLAARRVMVGRGGTGTAALGNAIGNTGGEEAHALTAAENGMHSHSSITLPVAEADNPNPPLNVAVIGNNSANGGYGTYSGGSTGTSSSGSGTPHNIIQPSLVTMMIIKT